MLISTGGVIRGQIDPVSAVIHQEINGEYSCDVSIALTDDLAEYFIEDAIVYLDDADETTQQFRLEKPERTLDSLSAFGWHISQDLAHDIIVSEKYTNEEGSVVWADLLQAGISETRFTGTADSSDLASLTIVRQSVLNALIGDQDNSYLNRWGGEIERDNFTVNMKTQLGEDRDYHIVYRKNLTGIHVTVDNATVVNRIVPTYLNENDSATLLSEVYIDSAKIADTAVPHAATVHYSDIRVGEEVDGSVPYPDTASAESEVRDRVADLYAAGLDVAMLTVEIEFVQLRNTIEYAEYKALETVCLGDTIGAEYEDYSWTSRVVAYDWDAVLQRYEKLTIGNVRPDASDMSNSIVDKASLAANAALAQRTVELTGAIASAQTTADGKNTVYYSSTEPTGGDYIENDIWFDTDDSNKMFLHDGSVWNPVQFGENAIADLAITNAKIADATIQNAKIANLDAGKVTTGVLDAARVEIGSGTSFDSGYDPSDKADQETTATIDTKNAVIKINTTDGFAYYDGTTYRGGIKVVNGKLALVSDVIANASELDQYIDYDIVDTDIYGMRFYTLESGSPVQTLGIYTYTSTDNRISHIGAMSGGSDRWATLSLYAAEGLNDSPSGSSHITLQSENTSYKPMIQLYAVDTSENSGLININHDSVEIKIDLSTVGEWTSNGLDVTGEVIASGGLYLPDASATNNALKIGSGTYYNGLSKRESGITLYANHNEGGFNVRIHSNNESFTDRLVVKADGVTVGAQLNLGSNNIVGSKSDCWITARRIGLGVSANSTYTMDAGTGYIRGSKYYAGSQGGINMTFKAQDMSGNYYAFNIVGGIIVDASLLP